MKRLTCLPVGVAGMVLLTASVAAAAGPADDVGTMATRINKVSSTTLQERYSREIHKSVNAAAIEDMARTCAQKHPGTGNQTFTMLGVMRIDGVLKSAVPVPDNAFTSCVADNIGSTHFPLPPGNGHGWPVGIQFDGKTGRVIYMAGDVQPGMPQYQSSTMSAMQWVYTPLPTVPANLSSPCKVSIWVSVGGDGRVESAEVGDTTCPSNLNKSVVDAMRQWLKAGAHGATSDESMDSRVSFNIDRALIRVTL